MPCFECSPPVFVFWLWPWPKPGLIRSVIDAAGHPLPELVDHVGRAAVDVDALLDDQRESFRVEDVGRVDDRRRIAVRRVAGGQGAPDLARADGIDQHAVAADQVEDGQVRARLLGVADHVKGGEVGDALDDRGGVVDVAGRSELPRSSPTGIPAISLRNAGKRSVSDVFMDCSTAKVMTIWCCERRRRLRRENLSPYNDSTTDQCRGRSTA